MENILNFETPKKTRSTKNHKNTFSSDSGIDGTYVPNMSDEDKKKWKAKHIKGDDERVEIRKSFDGVQLLVVVYKNPNPVEFNGNTDEWHKRHNDIKISMNGKLDLTWSDWGDMYEAINEALEILL